MYTRIQEALASESISGEGVEFGGSNGVIQSMFPQVKWEARNLPQHDITKESSYERNWDVIIADQVLQHAPRLNVGCEGFNFLGLHLPHVEVGKRQLVQLDGLDGHFSLL